MKSLKYDEIRRILPALDELRPVFDQLLTQSSPDAAHSWSGSGELHTTGDRRVDIGQIADSATKLAEREHAHLSSVLRSVGQALGRLAEGDSSAAAEQLLRAAALEEARGRQTRASAYAEAAYRTARQGKNQNTAALALRRWARAARSLGHLPEAAERYEHAFSISNATSDWRGAAEAAIGAGIVFEQRGRWVEAQNWYERALEVLDRTAEAAPERWQAMVNIHIVLRSSGAVEESLPWLTKATNEARALGDASATPFLENARGQLHVWLGEFDAAEDAFRRGLESTSHPGARVTIRLNLAESLLARGRFLDASEAAREAEREALVGRVSPKLPEIYRLLGRIAASTGNSGAFVLFERALEAVREHGLPILEEAATLQAYAEFERGRGEDAAAADLMKRARELYTSLGIEHLRHPWTDVYAKHKAQSDD